MAAAITARSGSGTIIKAQTAVHVEVTGAEANVAANRSGSISANSLANPTVVTSVAHGLETGDVIVIAGSNSTPTINGSRTITKTGADTFTVPVNVSVAGTAGTWTFTSDAESRDIGTEKRYYILVDAPGGVDDGRSHVFSPSADGKHTWDDYIFPAAGSYTLRLRDMVDDTDVATASVTVAAS